MEFALQIDEGCALDVWLRFLSRQWVGHIVWALGRVPEHRFSALRRALPGRVSARVLTARLRDLETLGLICRIDRGDVKRRNVGYALTTDGKKIDKVLRDLQLRLERPDLGAALTKLGRRLAPRPDTR
jgi:DNA-binding HxlR family transcriptional regulator